jgi:hypothetical protein
MHERLTQVLLAALTFAFAWWGIAVDKAVDQVAVAAAEVLVLRSEVQSMRDELRDLKKALSDHVLARAHAGASADMEAVKRELDRIEARHAAESRAQRANK